MNASTPSEEDFLASLDAELSTVTHKADLEFRKAKALHQSKGASDNRRAALRAEAGSIQAELAAMQWKATATVAMFAVQRCTCCNTTSRIFIQHMQRQITNYGPKVKRLVRTNRLTDGLPRETLLQHTTTGICFSCMEDHGFPVDGTALLVKDLLTIPVGYTPEALDLPAVYLTEEDD